MSRRRQKTELAKKKKSAKEEKEPLQYEPAKNLGGKHGTNRFPKARNS